jgi:hypothetical protein
MTSEGKWTPETIRALGPTTDLPTLGAISSAAGGSPTRWHGKANGSRLASRSSRSGRSTGSSSSRSSTSWDTAPPTSLGSTPRGPHTRLNCSGHLGLPVGSRTPRRRTDTRSRAQHLPYRSWAIHGHAEPPGQTSSGRLLPRRNRDDARTAREQPVAWRTIPARGDPRRAGMRTNAVLASHTGRPNSPFASRREMQ